MSRGEFSAYALPQYQKFSVEERELLVKDWLAELQDLGVDPDADAPDEQDFSNQRSGRELELVKSQLKNMVSGYISLRSFDAVFIQPTVGHSHQPLHRSCGGFLGRLQKPCGSGPRFLHLLIGRLPHDLRSREPCCARRYQSIQHLNPVSDDFVTKELSTHSLLGGLITRSWTPRLSLCLRSLAALSLASSTRVAVGGVSVARPRSTNGPAMMTLKRTFPPHTSPLLALLSLQLQLAPPDHGEGESEGHVQAHCSIQISD